MQPESLVTRIIGSISTQNRVRYFIAEFEVTFYMKTTWRDIVKIKRPSPLLFSGKPC